MENNRLTILGAGESGVGAALLGRAKGYEVWLSDNGAIPANYKKEIEANSISYEEGGHSLDKILKAGIIVKSPGIPDSAAIVQAAVAEGIEVISEIEFSSRYTDKKIVAITGSNGKTTTTLLIHHILSSVGIKAGLTGNIGSSLARHVLTDEDDVFVVELSSFQLDGTRDFCPNIAVLLNITPDHLDRYSYDFDRYALSKMSITKNMHSGIVVYNLQDPELAKRVSDLPKGVEMETFSLDQDTSSKVQNGMLSVRSGERNLSIPIEELSLKGEHNQMNLMAAVLVAFAFDISNEAILAALPSFKNQPNRLEYITTINGVDFINDSKATNVDSVYYALGSYTKPIVWIAGGQDKGNDYSKIAALVKERVKAMVCLGIDNATLLENFASSVDQIAETQSTDEAAKLALSFAEPEGVVLLSPACASFDIFENYVQRGEMFKKSVLDLKEKMV